MDFDKPVNSAALWTSAYLALLVRLDPAEAEIAADDALERMTRRRQNPEGWRLMALEDFLASVWPGAYFTDAVGPSPEPESVASPR